MPPFGQRDAAIELLNVPSDGKVYQRLLLVIGRLHTNTNLARNSNSPDAVIEVKSDGFDVCQWEVNDTWFKALVPLSIGRNKVKLTALDIQKQLSGVETELNIEYEVLRRPLLHLVILAAQDSPAWGPIAAGEPKKSETAPSPSHTAQRSMPTIPANTGKNSNASQNLLERSRKFLTSLSSDHPVTRSPVTQPALVDSPPGWRRDRLMAGGLEFIKRLLALQALTWQAFYSEQMYRQGFGHRAFGLEEHTERRNGQMDLAALLVVHVLRSTHTLKEFRDINNAQQHKTASNGGAMHSFAGEALQQADFWRRGPPGSAVGVLILDSTWDPTLPLLRAHAAVGSHGGLRSGSLSHGVMGSHWLWAAPASLAEVSSSFLDTNAVDPKYCCNDLGEGRTVGLTVNIGSGAMLHEVGHALDNPHWPSGIMARGYIEWNRAFMTRETHSLRGGNAHSLKPITPDMDSQENHLHRCQALRARLHPAFALPGDPSPAHRGHRPWEDWTDEEPLFFPGLEGVSIDTAAGIAMVAVQVGDKQISHLEFGFDGQAPPTSFVMTPAQASSIVGFDVMAPGVPDIKLLVTGWNLRHGELNSYRRMGLARPIVVPGIDMRAYGRTVRNGPRTKIDDDPSHEHQTILFNSSWKGGPQLERVDLFAHNAVYALGFQFSDRSSQLVGKMPQGEPPKASITLRPGQSISSIDVKSGWWIDALSVAVSGGQSSPFVGGNGGGRRSLRAAREQEEIVGVSASMGAWMDSLGVLVSDKR